MQIFFDVHAFERMQERVISYDEVELTGGEVNVDFDSNNRVTGIEMLSADPEEVEAVAKIATAHRLSIATLFSGNAKRV